MSPFLLSVNRYKRENEEGMWKKAKTISQLGVLASWSKKFHQVLLETLNFKMEADKAEKEGKAMGSLYFDD